MRWRLLILAAVFVVTFAATYAIWPEVGPAFGLMMGMLVTLVAVYAMMTNGSGRRARRRHQADDPVYYGAAFVAGSHLSSPADCAGGAGSFGGDCGAGGV